MHDLGVCESDSGQIPPQCAKMRVEIHGGVGGHLDEHQAVSLLGRARYQMLLCINIAAEPGFLRNTDCLAAGVKGPAVESTGEAAGLAALVSHQARSAVRAD